MAFDQLSELDTTRTTWKIKIRVTRMWPSISFHAAEGRNSLKGYNLILLDDNNSHVQAFVYTDQWNSIADKVEEGSIYVISNFYTKEATGTLKPVSSKILINFSPSTTVEKIPEDDFMIPRHKFEFVDLGDLFNVASAYTNVEYPEFSTDVIGVIEEFQNVSLIKTKFGMRNIVRFRITDGRNHHQVTVWGDIAVQADSCYHKATETPIIVILTSTRLKTYKNSVQISSLPSSKIYINMDNDSVLAMRYRLEEEGYTISQQSNFTPPPEAVVQKTIETVSLKELSEKNGTQFNKKHFFCNVKVLKVEEGNWWYDSCSDCEGEVEKVEGKLKCSNCTNKTIPVPEKRYRIVILAEDSTEAYNFILMDRAARRLIGMTATKLQSDMIKSNMSFHPKIKEIDGKDIKLKIQLEVDNINSGSHLYYATDAYDSSTSIPEMSPGTPSYPGISAFTETNTIQLSDFGATPPSVTSTSKKIKTEK